MSAQLDTLAIEKAKFLAEKEKLEAETERFRQEMKREPYKAFAAILAGVIAASAAMTATILAVAHFIRP